MTIDIKTSEHERFEDDPIWRARCKKYQEELLAAQKAQDNAEREGEQKRRRWTGQRPDAERVARNAARKTVE